MRTSVKYTLASLFVLLLGFTGIFEPLRSIFQSITNPVQYGLYTFSSDLREEFMFFSNIRGIRNENLKLAEEKDTLLSEIAKYKELEQENSILKEQLKLNTEHETNFISAKVIGLPFDSENSEVVINKGLKDGVSLDSFVIYKNFLVGSVTDVSENRSTVIFLTSPKLSIAVVDITEGERAKGLVTGSFGTFLTMTRILPDEKIEVGDMIATSGQDGKFDSGLLVGEVTEVSDSNSSEPLKNAKLKTYLDFSRLENLFVSIKEVK